MMTRVAYLVMSAVLLVPSLARSEPLRLGPHDVAALFSISKSENKNEVVFGIRLDAQCVPVGNAPVFAYWRMNEKGPGVTESLLAREEPAYGIGRQRVLAGGKVEFTMRALASRPVVVETKTGDDGRCKASSTLTIATESAHVYNVYVKLKELGRVDFILLSGWSMDGTRVVREKINP